MEEAYEKLSRVGADDVVAVAARDWIFRVETGRSGNSAPGSGTAHKEVVDTMVKMRKWPWPLEKKILDGGISAAGPERLCLLHTREQGAGAGWCMVCVCDIGITATSWDFAER